MLALLAVASSVAWGSSDFVGGLLTKRLPAVAVVAWSQAVALLIMTLVITVRREWEVGPWLPYAMGAGAVGAAALVCFYTALSTGTMGVVAPIASLGVVVPILAGVVRGDNPGWLAWCGMAVAIVGVVLASGPELSGGASPLPVALAAAAGLGFGLALLLIDIGARDSVIHTLWGMRATSVLAFVVAGLILRTAGGVGPRDLPLLAAVGIGDGTANGLFAVASSGGLVSLASALSSLYPVVTVLLARAVLGERLRRVQSVGVALSLAGAIAMAL